MYVEALDIEERSDDKGKEIEHDADEDSDYENELDEEWEDEEEEAGNQDADMGSGPLLLLPSSRDYVQKQIEKLKEFYSPSKEKAQVGTSGNTGENSSSDSDFLPGDDEASEQDDEANEILKNFKQFKKKVNSGQAAQLDDVFIQGSHTQAGDCTVIEDEGHGTPYVNSSDDDESSDDSDGSRGVSKYPRFSKKNPKFSLGMKFSGKKQFKKAIIKYGLAERKVIKFIKDEADRVRAKCDWPTCPWVCLLSTNSTTSSWQIASFKNKHTCPPRRDNSLVTARRIAEKYEKMIMSNPTWRLDSMKAIVQRNVCRCKYS